MAATDIGSDHFTQSEVEQLDVALGDAQQQSQASNDTRSRSFGEPAGSASYLTGLLKQVPGAGQLCRQAEQLQRSSDEQERIIDPTSRSIQADSRFQGPPGSVGGPPGPGIPGMSPDFDPKKTIAQIYPILEFRDKVVRLINTTIEKIPGLEALVEKITETVTLFVMSLLAPFIRPIINAVSQQLKAGSTSVVDSSGKHQYEPWTDPHCTDPTHSLLSKDHFANVLNEPAGKVAATVLQYVAPRIIFAWEHPDVPVDQVLNDIVRVFHHPAIRDRQCELHCIMYAVVESWALSRPNRGADLNTLLSSYGVRHGKNLIAEDSGDHKHGSFPLMAELAGSSAIPSQDNGNSRNTINSSTPVKLFKEEYPGTETRNDTSSTSPAPAWNYAYGQPPPQPPYGQPSYGQEQITPQNHPYGAQYRAEEPPQPTYQLYGNQPLQAPYGAPYGAPSQSERYPAQGYPQPPYGYDPSSGPPPPAPKPHGYGGPNSGHSASYYGGAPY